MIVKYASLPLIKIRLILTKGLRFILTRSTTLIKKNCYRAKRGPALMFYKKQNLTSCFPSLKNFYSLYKFHSLKSLSLLSLLRRRLLLRRSKSILKQEPSRYVEFILQISFFISCGSSLWFDFRPKTLFFCLHQLPTLRFLKG